MIEYGTNESWIWHGPTEELRFRMSQDDRQILCRVTRECIADHCGNRRCRQKTPPRSRGPHARKTRHRKASRGASGKPCRRRGPT